MTCWPAERLSVSVKEGKKREERPVREPLIEGEGKVVVVRVGAVERGVPCAGDVPARLVRIVFEIDLFAHAAAVAVVVGERVPEVESGAFAFDERVVAVDGRFDPVVAEVPG